MIGIRHCMGLALVCTLLVGCGAPTTMSRVHVAGVPSLFAYAAGGRDMQTVVVGNPFPVPTAEVEKAITDAMQGNHYGPPTRFTTDPSAHTRAGYRIVIMFDPPHTLPNRVVCGDTERLSADPNGERLRLITAFCVKDSLKSEVVATMAPVASPHAPELGDLIASSMWLLIPAIDPATRGPSCQNRLNC